jgi:hypothetical protein
VWAISEAVSKEDSVAVSEAESVAVSKSREQGHRHPLPTIFYVSKENNIIKKIRLRLPNPSTGTSSRSAEMV